MGDKPAIEVRNLSKSFGRKNKIIDKVSFKINSGDKVSLIGHSGGGKSVLAKDFIGLIKPDCGEISIFGRKIKDIPDHPYSLGKDGKYMTTKISYAFQKGALFDSHTVYKNLIMPLDEQKVSEEELIQRARQYLTDVGLGKNLERILQSKPSTLSGGEEKRVSIARALMQETPIIIYDEPTTGLDPERSFQILELINKLHYEKKKTSIVITHDTDLMRIIGEKVIFLYEGKIYFFGDFRTFANTDDPVINSYLCKDKKRRIEEIEKENHNTT